MKHHSCGTNIRFLCTFASRKDMFSRNTRNEPAQPGGPAYRVEHRAPFARSGHYPLHIGHSVLHLHYNCIDIRGRHCDNVSDPLLEDSILVVHVPSDLASSPTRPKPSGSMRAYLAFPLVFSMAISMPTQGNFCKYAQKGGHSRVSSFCYNGKALRGYG